MRGISVGFVLCFVFLSVSAHAATYYVDATNGNDNYNGLYPAFQLGSDGPWRTLDKVNAQSFYANDTIHFKRGGVWRGQLDVDWSGEPGNPITFKDYGMGEKPIFLGSEKRIGWTNEGGNLWYASNSWNPTEGILFVNTDDSVDWGDRKTNKGDLVDEYDWWYDSGNTRLYVYVANDPDTRYNSVEIPRNVNTFIVKVYGQSYLKFENIVTKYSGWDGFRTNHQVSTDCSYIDLINCESHYNTHHGFKAASDGGAVERVETHHIYYTNCVASYNGYHGFQASDSTGDIYYENCVSHHNSQTPGQHPEWEGAGFRMGETLYGLIKNCESYNNFYGIRIAGWYYEIDGITVEGCDVHDNSHQGILLLADSNFKFYNMIFRRNKIYDNGGCGLSMARPMQDGQCYYNLIYGNNGGLSWQYYYSGGNSTVYNNVIASNTGTGLAVGSGAVVTFKNNIIYQNSNQLSVNSGTFDYNNYYPGVSFSQKGPNDMSADPLFQNAGINDYRLQSNSPCINNGTDVGLTLDFEGNSVPYGTLPDIGAYEYGFQPSNCTGTCRLNPCDTYDYCTDGSGTCVTGYCCSGTCSICNNNICEQGENCSSCPEDCGCVLPQICCDGVCSLPACFNESDCGTDPCKDYVCSNPGTCSASCSSQDITSCVNNDSCCPPGCKVENDNDCIIPGPVAWYHFDENSGNITGDSSGNGNDGTIYGANWTSRISGYALEFDGVDDSVEAGNSESLNLSQKVTITAWINPSSISIWDRIVAKSHTSDNSPYTMYGLLFDDANHVRLEIATGGTQNSVDGLTTIPTNEWIFVAGTYDGSSLRVHINGSLDNSAPHSGNIDTNNMPLSIGRSGFGSNYFEGKIDEVRIYNRALTQEEILNLYNNPGGEQIPGDLNNDGYVDILDLGIIAANFGKTSGYDPRADVVDNNEIDVFDLVYVASRFT